MIDRLMDRHIHESNLIEGIYDPEEDKRSMRAWNWLKKQPVINHEILLSLHRRITLKQLGKRESGHYRQIQVYVGDHIPPAAPMVPHLIENFMLDLHDQLLLNDPIKMHVRYETIHPFVDGNGRTGRMVLWWHEMRQGKQATLFLNAEKFEKYYPLFRSSSGLPRRP